MLIHWIGSFHPFLLHFPIALITMTVIAECLFFWFKNPLFYQASRFMIIGAAIAAVPTVLCGLAFAYGGHKVGHMADLLWWHRLLGISSMFLVITAACLKELYIRKKWNTQIVYWACLFLVFITVNITGHLGGYMTFPKSWALSLFGH